jgi:hypothetical protein
MLRSPTSLIGVWGDFKMLFYLVNNYLLDETNQSKRSAGTLTARLRFKDESKPLARRINPEDADTMSASIQSKTPTPTTDGRRHRRRSGTMGSGGFRFLWPLKGTRRRNCGPDNTTFIRFTIILPENITKP